MVKDSVLREQVREIAELSTYDHESAHSKEDYLYEMFIRLVAQGSNKMWAKKAMIVLKTKDIAFPRWCA